MNLLMESCDRGYRLYRCAGVCLYITVDLCLWSTYVLTYHFGDVIRCLL